MVAGRWLEAKSQLKMLLRTSAANTQFHSLLKAFKRHNLPVPESSHRVSWGVALVREFLDCAPIPKSPHTDIRQSILDAVRKRKYRIAHQKLKILINRYTPGDYVAVAATLKRWKVPVIVKGKRKKGSWSLKHVFLCIGKPYKQRNMTTTSLVKIREYIKKDQLQKAAADLQTYFAERTDCNPGATAECLRSAGVPVLINGEIILHTVWKAALVRRACGSEKPHRKYTDLPAEIIKSDSHKDGSSDFKLKRYISERYDPKHPDCYNLASSLRKCKMPAVFNGCTAKNWAPTLVRLIAEDCELRESELSATPSEITLALQFKKEAIAKKRLKSWLAHPTTTKQPTSAVANTLKRTKVPLFNSGQFNNSSTYKHWNARAVHIVRIELDLNNADQHECQPNSLAGTDSLPLPTQANPSHIKLLLTSNKLQEAQNEFKTWIIEHQSCQPSAQAKLLKKAQVPGFVYTSEDAIQFKSSHSKGDWTSVTVSEITCRLAASDSNIKMPKVVLAQVTLALSHQAIGIAKTRLKQWFEDPSKAQNKFWNQARMLKDHKLPVLTGGKFEEYSATISWTADTVRAARQYLHDFHHSSVSAQHAIEPSAIEPSAIEPSAIEPSVSKPSTRHARQGKSRSTAALKRKRPLSEGQCAALPPPTHKPRQEGAPAKKRLNQTKKRRRRLVL